MIYHTAGDVFKLFPQYRMTGNGGGEDAADTLDDSIAALSRRYHLDHYPWSGAISTHHSFLYLLRYGQRVFAQGWQGVKNPGHSPKKSLRPKFSLAEARRHEESFMHRYLARALQPGQEGGPAPLSFKHFSRELRNR